MVRVCVCVCVRECVCVCLRRSACSKKGRCTILACVNPVRSRLRVGNISLLTVLFGNLLVDILQDEFHGLVKVGDVSHFKLGPISEEYHHITISKQSLDGSDLYNVGENDFGHVLATNSRCDADATSGDLVTDPSLTGPRRCSGDDSDDGEDGDGGDNSLRNGGRAFVKYFLWCQASCRLGGLGSGGSTLSFSAFGLQVDFLSITMRRMKQDTTTVKKKQSVGSEKKEKNQMREQV